TCVSCFTLRVATLTDLEKQLRVAAVDQRVYCVVEVDDLCRHRGRIEVPALQQLEDAREVSARVNATGSECRALGVEREHRQRRHPCLAEVGGNRGADAVAGEAADRELEGAYLAARLDRYRKRAVEAVGYALEGLGTDLRSDPEAERVVV